MAGFGGHRQRRTLIFGVGAVVGTVVSGWYGIHPGSGWADTADLVAPLTGFAGLLLALLVRARHREAALPWCCA
ncbi:hypothetical protein [Streptomyces odontomachi]|uniref:hypothetical protein n=1 Tax=Streptomyces odontomachi TaxID=2944940 RepID=UPI002108F963|nr:hypothetical protein [Streptomyces sp. ODS25]